MSTTHTPVPWHVFEPISKHGTGASVGAWLPSGETRYLICETIDIPLDDMGTKVDHRVAKANSEFIVRAVNSHAALLAACEAAAKFMAANHSVHEYKESSALRSALRAAIAKAKGDNANV